VIKITAKKLVESKLEPNPTTAKPFDKKKHNIPIGKPTMPINKNIVDDNEGVEENMDFNANEGRGMRT